MVVAQAYLKAGDLILGYRRATASVPGFSPCQWRLAEIRGGEWWGYIGANEHLSALCGTTGPYDFQVERASERTDLYRLLGVER